jgi:myo-inositol-1(or 4)-monophosphatase
MLSRPETTCAVAAARAAGALASRRTDATTVIQKGELDIATGTDLACEDAIRGLLTQRYPKYAIVGEERGGTPTQDGATYWLIDPLCGTQTYASRIPAFCTNIALVEGGVVTVAAVFDGATGEVYAAERGHGAYLVRPDDSEALSARDGTVLGFDLAGFPSASLDAKAVGSLFGSLIGQGRWHVRFLGTTLPFARVATGDFTALFLVGRVSSPLHTAAGCLLAEEAGAVVTDVVGAPWNLQTTSFVVAATQALHRELLQIYRAAFGTG